MPIVLFLLGLTAVGALALKAGQAKTEAERGHDPLGDPTLPPAPVVNGSPHVGCYEVRLGGVIGLCDEDQAVRIAGAHPRATFRRIG